MADDRVSIARQVIARLGETPDAERIARRHAKPREVPSLRRVKKTRSPSAEVAKVKKPRKSRAMGPRQELVPVTSGRSHGRSEEEEAVIPPGWELPYSALRTPAREDSNTKPPAFLSGNDEYRGLSDPGRSRKGLDWRSFSMQFRVDPNDRQIRGILKFWTEFFGHRFVEAMKNVSPGSIKDNWRLEVGYGGGEAQDRVIMRVWNNHVAFPRLIYGTASRRVWPAKRPKYPIVPLEVGAETPEERRTYIEGLEAASGKYTEEEFGTIGRKTKYSDYRTEMVGRLKFSGSWVSPTSAPAAFRARSTRRGQPSTRSFPGGKSYTSSSSANKRGEIFVPYVKQHPGVAPHMPLNQEWNAWKNGERLRKRHGEVRSKIGKMILEAMRAQWNPLDTTIDGVPVLGVPQMKARAQ